MGEPDASTARTIAADIAPTEGAVSPSSRRMRFWLASRLLATAGALLVALAAWIPWVSVRVFDVARTNYLGRPVLLDPGDLDASYFGGLAWAILTVLGLWLLPFLWQRPRTIRSLPLAPMFYIVWMLALVGFGSTSVDNVIHPSTTRLAPELGSKLIGTDQIQYLPGTLVGALGLLLSILGAFVLVIGLLRIPLDVRPIPTSAGRRRPAIGALVFGVLLFWLGTLVLPWSTVNCTATPLFFGQCTGLPFDGVLADAIRADVPGIDPLAALYGVNVLLSGSALLVLLAVFTGARSRYFAFWTTVWLLIATGFVALASVGVRLVASAPADFGLRGAWNGDMGIFVTLLALALGWLGVGALWLGGQRPAPA